MQLFLPQFHSDVFDTGILGLHCPEIGVVDAKHRIACFSSSSVDMEEAKVTRSLENSWKRAKRIGQNIGASTGDGYPSKC